MQIKLGMGIDRYWSSRPVGPPKSCCRSIFPPPRPRRLFLSFFLAGQKLKTAQLITIDPCGTTTYSAIPIHIVFKMCIKY